MQSAAAKPRKAAEPKPIDVEAVAAEAVEAKTSPLLSKFFENERELLPMLNVAVVMGRLVADPELRHTPSDVAVTSFTLAGRPLLC